MRSRAIPAFALLVAIGGAALSISLGDIFFGILVLGFCAVFVVVWRFRSWREVHADRSGTRDDAPAAERRMQSHGGSLGAIWFGIWVAVAIVGTPLALYERNYWMALLCTALAVGAGRAAYVDLRRRNF
jgi:hypothetical protein